MEQQADRQPDEYDPTKDPKRKAKSNDPGWKYGFWSDLTDKNKVQCILCGKQIKGGIKRFKQHLIGGYGDVVKCTKTTTDIAREMNEVLMRNKRRTIELDAYVDHDDVDVELNSPPPSEESVRRPPSSSKGSSTIPSSGTSAKRMRALTPNVRESQKKGLMDAHVRRTPEEVVDERRRKGHSQTTIDSHFRSPEEKERVMKHIADFFYENGISFNAARSRSYEVMIESIGQYGPGLKPPSYHELRVSLLEKAKTSTGDLRKHYEASWKQYGCTLMSDGWTDRKGRHLINFLVNCPRGTFFMESVDASHEIHDANMLFELLDSKIEEIGEHNVVQVVTDNAANYARAGTLLMQKRKHLFWTPCAAHCLDLMLEDIGKLKGIKGTISRAKRVTTFIYKSPRLLAAMRVKTDGKDLVRSAVTRFATSFLTLQSLYKNKDALRQLFVSDEWKNSKMSKSEAGKAVAETILSVTFWNGVQDCLRASQPLLVVLRIVDADERPAMPELYLAMEEAKEKIKFNFGDKERLWKKYIKIVDKRWECQMGRPLYGAALFLNPGKYFDYAEKDIESSWKLFDAFSDVLVKMEPDQDVQDKILLNVNNYKGQRLCFAKKLAIRSRTRMNSSKYNDLDLYFY